MELPFISLSSFILSLFGVLGVSLALFKAVDYSIIFFKKNME